MEENITIKKLKNIVEKMAYKRYLLLHIIQKIMDSLNDITKLLFLVLKHYYIEVVYVKNFGITPLFTRIIYIIKHHILA